VGILEIDEWAVARVEVEPWGHELPDRCWLFRSSTTWTLVTMRRSGRYGERDEAIEGRASVSTLQFGTVEALREHIDSAYNSQTWVDLLDAGAEHDAELYRAWVPERLRRDIDAASVWNKDLALYTDVFGGTAVPAVARELPGWKRAAVAQMADHLDELGFEVPSRRARGPRCHANGPGCPGSPPRRLVDGRGREVGRRGRDLRPAARPLRGPRASLAPCTCGGGRLVSSTGLVADSCSGPLRRVEDRRGLLSPVPNVSADPSRGSTGLLWGRFWRGGPRERRRRPPGVAGWAPGGGARCGEITLPLGSRSGVPGRCPHAPERRSHRPPRLDPAGAGTTSSM